MDHLCFFLSCVSHAFASVHCFLVATCWERAALLALVGDIHCIFVTFPHGILGQVWYFIVSFPVFAVFLTLNIQSKLYKTNKKVSIMSMTRKCHSILRKSSRYPEVELNASYTFNERQYSNNLKTIKVSTLC